MTPLIRILALLAALVTSLHAADGDPYNVRFIQRDAGGEPITIDIDGAANVGKAIGFTAPGVLGPISIVGGEGGITDGNKGAITVSGGGGVWAINVGAVTSPHIADGTIVNADIAAAAAIDLSKLAVDPLARANHTGTQAAGTITGLAASATTDATNASNISSGTLPAARLPTPGTTTLGGVRRNAGAGGQYVTGIDTDGSLLFDAPSGTGDVTAASAFGADNLLLRSDGTGKGVQASGIMLDDDNNISGVGTLSVDVLNTDALNTDALFLFESDGVGTETVELYIDSSHSANRRLGLSLNDANTVLTIPGSMTLLGTASDLDATNLASGIVPAARLPAPGTTTLGGVKRNTGAAGEYVTGISAAGDLLFDEPAGGGGGLSAADIDTSAELRAILTDETGTGAAVFADSPTLTGTVTVDILQIETLAADGIEFEGSTADEHETTIVVVDPTADRTWTVPDTSDTFAGLASTQTLTNKTISGTDNTVTNLSASNLASGTVPDARFPATLPAASGVNLTALNAGNLASGTVGTARLGSGTADSTTYLRGDNTWATPSGAGGAPGISGFRQNVFLWEEFLTPTPFSNLIALGSFGFTRISSGTGAIGGAVVGSPTAPGIFELVTGTTDSGTSLVRSAPIGIRFGDGAYTLEARIRLTQLQAVGTQEFSFACGFHDGNSTPVAPDGTYFLYDIASSNWQIVNRSNSTGSATATATAVSADTWYKLRVEVNAAASSVAYYIDGAEASGSPLTANIPNGINRQTGVQFGIFKSVGTASVTAEIDYIGLEIALSAAR